MSLHVLIHTLEYSFPAIPEPLAVRRNQLKPLKLPFYTLAASNAIGAISALIAEPHVKLLASRLPFSHHFS